MADAVDLVDEVVAADMAESFMKSKSIVFLHVQCLIATYHRGAAARARSAVVECEHCCSEVEM